MLNTGKLTIAFVLLWSAKYASSQNLISNPTFELNRPLRQNNGEFWDISSADYACCGVTLKEPKNSSNLMKPGWVLFNHHWQSPIESVIPNKEKAHLYYTLSLRREKNVAAVLFSFDNQHLFAHTKSTILLNRLNERIKRKKRYCLKMDVIGLDAQKHSGTMVYLSRKIPDSFDDMESKRVQKISLPEIDRYINSSTWVNYTVDFIADDNYPFLSIGNTGEKYPIEIDIQDSLRLLQKKLCGHNACSTQYIHDWGLKAWALDNVELYEIDGSKQCPREKIQEPLRNYALLDSVFYDCFRHIAQRYFTLIDTTITGEKDKVDSFCELAKESNPSVRRYLFWVEIIDTGHFLNEEQLNRIKQSLSNEWGLDLSQFSYLNSISQEYKIRHANLSKFNGFDQSGPYLGFALISSYIPEQYVEDFNLD